MCRPVGGHENNKCFAKDNLRNQTKIIRLLSFSERKTEISR